jgi:hypothetical protein
MHANQRANYAPKAMGLVKESSPVYNSNQRDKRNFERVHLAQPVRVQFKEPGQFSGTLSCDLSEGGIRLHMNEFIPIGTELILTIQLADDRIEECPCRVVWVQKNRFVD